MSHRLTGAVLGLFLACFSVSEAVANDSLRYLRATDTVMLEIERDLTKYTYHTFSPQQTVYALGRFYGQDVGEVLRWNPELAQAPASIGQRVRIPVPNRAITRFRGADWQRDSYAPVCYTVRPGETMFHVAKRVFRMPVDTLLAVNRLADHTLQPGQVLQVGWMALGGTPPLPDRAREMSPLERVNLANGRAHARQPARKPRTGAASWTPGTGEAGLRLFALTDWAPRGSYLRVANSANGRVAYVRVLGPAPDAVRRERVDVHLSATAAQLLGAGSGNFYVTVE